MIIMIDPRKHEGNKALINTMLANYSKKSGMDIRMTDLPKATFIIAYDKHRGVIGGAWLMQESRYSPYAQPYWVCYGIHYCLDENEPGLTHISNHSPLRRIFYEDLYESLINFGLSQDVSFIVTYHSKEEHERLKFLGDWPFTFESMSDQNPAMVYGAVHLTHDVQMTYPERHLYI